MKIDLFVVMIKFQIVLFEISLTEIFVFAALNLARRIVLRKTQRSNITRWGRPKLQFSSPHVKFKV